MSREERSDSPRNLFLMVLMVVLAFLVNPIVKLKDRLKGESG